jgi:hypothetical protein
MHAAHAINGPTYAHAIVTTQIVADAVRICFKAGPSRKTI